jgi:hypothetical protein
MQSCPDNNSKPYQENYFQASNCFLTNQKVAGSSVINLEFTFSRRHFSKAFAKATEVFKGTLLCSLFIKGHATALGSSRNTRLPLLSYQKAALREIKKKKHSAAFPQGSFAETGEICNLPNS